MWMNEINRDFSELYRPKIEAAKGSENCWNELFADSDFPKWCGKVREKMSFVAAWTVLPNGSWDQSKLPEAELREVKLRGSDWLWLRKALRHGAHYYPTSWLSQTHHAIYDVDALFLGASTKSRRP